MDTAVAKSEGVFGLGERGNENRSENNFILFGYRMKIREDKKLR